LLEAAFKGVMHFNSTSASFKGEIQLNVGKYGKLTVE